jgi:hypothetical protein
MFAMRMRRIAATALVLTISGDAAPLGLAGAQASITMAGTARDEAKKPFPDYAARAREVEAGQIVSTTPLDENGNFTMTSLKATKYVIELTNKDGKVVCTEGPFDMTKSALKNDVVIDCDKVPAAWWLLGAAAAAGITAGTATGSPASPAN